MWRIRCKILNLDFQYTFIVGYVSFLIVEYYTARELIDSVNEIKACGER